jgi:hypothetical protein
MKDPAWERVTLVLTMSQFISDIFYGLGPTADLLAAFPG